MADVNPDELAMRYTARGLALAAEAMDKAGFNPELKARLTREAADCFTVAAALQKVTLV